MAAQPDSQFLQIPAATPRPSQKQSTKQQLRVFQIMNGFFAWQEKSGGLCRHARLCVTFCLA
jgi:hypothetical protein